MGCVNSTAWAEPAVYTVSCMRLAPVPEKRRQNRSEQNALIKRVAGTVIRLFRPVGYPRFPVEFQTIAC